MVATAGTAVRAVQQAQVVADQGRHAVLHLLVKHPDKLSTPLRILLVRASSRTKRIDIQWDLLLLGRRAKALGQLAT